MRRIGGVVFDVNETLASLEPLGAQLPEGALPLWFARVLRDGFARATAGGQPVFRELAAAHLANFVDEDQVDEVLAGFGRLPLHDDAVPALQRLRDAEVPVVTLTNGHAATTRSILDHAGALDLVAACLSVDDVGRWKPDPAPYLYAAGWLRLPPEQVALVAVHSWDIHGAKRAGLAAGWCSRFEGRYVAGFEPPDVTGDTVLEVVEGLLEL